MCDPTALPQGPFGVCGSAASGLRAFCLWVVPYPPLCLDFSASALKSHLKWHIFQTLQSRLCPCEPSHSTQFSFEVQITTVSNYLYNFVFMSVSSFDGSIPKGRVSFSLVPTMSRMPSIQNKLLLKAFLLGTELPTPPLSSLSTMNLFQEFPEQDKS